VDVVNGFGGDDKGPFLEFGSYIVFPEFLNENDLFRGVEKLEELGTG